MTAPTLRDRARTLANALEHFHPGDRAALRRLDPLAPAGTAFTRAAMIWEGDDQDLRGFDVVRVAALAQAIALLGDDARNLGALLAEAGFSDARLERLLRADAQALPDLAVSAARFLAAKGLGVHAEDLADLLFAPDDRQAEVRLNIARSYFRKTHQKEADSQ